MAYPRLAKGLIDIFTSRLLDANRRIVELADKAVADDTGRKKILDLYACKSENVSLGCSNER